MADLALGLVKDIVKIGVDIKEEVEKVRQNKKECQDLQVLVAITIAILSWLEEMKLTSHPAMCGALMSLNSSLDSALKLVTKCQKRNRMHRFLTARNLAEQLRLVHNDIQRKMLVVNLAISASTMKIATEFTRTTIIRHDGALPPPTQPQGGVEMIYGRHPTIGDARYDGARIRTMLTTGTEAPFAPSSSRWRYSILSEMVATRNVSKRCGRFVIEEKQKIVIKVGMTSQRLRYKAMQLMSAEAGVISFSFAGDGDHLVVEGEGVDSVALTSALRRKVAPAQLMQVNAIKTWSSERSGARVLQVLVLCALCTLVLLTSACWVLR